MTGPQGYVLEDTPEGKTLVATGPWSDDAAGALLRGEADGLTLNYARGFLEADLEFLDHRWGVRRLKILNRGLADLGPIERLGDSLESLSVQAGPEAELDLRVLPQLRSVAGEWALIAGTQSSVDALESVITWRFSESDFHSFRDHVGLRRLMIKEAPFLGSIDGVGQLPGLRLISVQMARRLCDIDEVTGLASSLREFKLELCPRLVSLDDVEPLRELRVLGASECGDIESLAPLVSLEHLEEFHAWGSTRIVDGDLSPLTRLPRLREIRMQDRRHYRPGVAELKSTLFD